MSGEFILNASKSFQLRIDTITEKKRQPYYVLFCVYLVILLFIFQN